MRYPVINMNSRYRLGQWDYSTDEALSKARDAYNDAVRSRDQAAIDRTYSEYRKAYEQFQEELPARDELEKLYEDNRQDLTGSSDPEIQKNLNKRMKEREARMEELWPGWYKWRVDRQIFEVTGGKPEWYRNMESAARSALDLAIMVTPMLPKGSRPSIPTGSQRQPAQPVRPSVPTPRAMPREPVQPSSYPTPSAARALSPAQPPTSPVRPPTPSMPAGGRGPGGGGGMPPPGQGPIPHPGDAPRSPGPGASWEELNEWGKKWDAWEKAYAEWLMAQPPKPPPPTPTKPIKESLPPQVMPIRPIQEPGKLTYPVPIGPYGEPWQPLKPVPETLPLQDPIKKAMEQLFPPAERGPWRWFPAPTSMVPSTDASRPMPVTDEAVAATTECSPGQVLDTASGQCIPEPVPTGYRRPGMPGIISAGLTLGPGAIQAPMLGAIRLTPGLGTRVFGY